MTKIAFQFHIKLNFEVTSFFYRFLLTSSWQIKPNKNLKTAPMITFKMFKQYYLLLICWFEIITNSYSGNLFLNLGRYYQIESEKIASSSSLSFNLKTWASNLTCSDGALKETHVLYWFIHYIGVIRYLKYVHNKI